MANSVMINRSATQSAGSPAGLPRRVWFGLAVVLAAIIAGVPLVDSRYDLGRFLFYHFSLIASLLPVVIYAFYARSQRSFDLFSPFFLPWLFWLAYYGIPTASIYHIWGVDPSDLSVVIHIVGITCFWIGLLTHWVIGGRRRLAPRRATPSRWTVTPLSLAAFSLLGVSLLVIYGLWSGVPLAMLSGCDVEQLRRTAEIGKGLIKEPGIFFTLVGSLAIFARACSSATAFRKRFWLIPLTAAAVLFLTTAHKAPAIWVGLFSLGVFAKYRVCSLTKLLLFAVILGSGLVVLDLIRSNGTISTMRLLSHGPLRYAHVYRANFEPLMAMVEEGRLPLQYGREYLQNAAIVLPRFLFPNKPVSFDYYLKDKLGMKFSGGGTPATPFGSLYLNFSMIGLCVAAGLLGFLYSAAYRRYRCAGGAVSTVLWMLLLSYLISPSPLLANVAMLVVFGGVLLIGNRILSDLDQTLHSGLSRHAHPSNQ